MVHLLQLVENVDEAAGEDDESSKEDWPEAAAGIGVSRAARVADDVATHDGPVGRETAAVAPFELSDEEHWGSPPRTQGRPLSVAHSVAHLTTRRSNARTGQ